MNAAFTVVPGIYGYNNTAQVATEDFWHVQTKQNGLPWTDPKVQQCLSWYQSVRASGLGVNNPDVNTQVQNRLVRPDYWSDIHSILGF
jgi:hypothetical protein